MHNSDSAAHPTTSEAPPEQLTPASAAPSAPDESSSPQPEPPLRVEADAQPANPAHDHAKRRAQLEQEKAEQLGLLRPIVASSNAAATRLSNQRRAPISKRHLAVVIAAEIGLLIAFATLLHSFFQARIEPYLNQRPAQSPVSPAPSSSPATDAAAQTELKKQLTATTDQLAETTAQLAQLQKQIDALRTADSKAESQLAILDERISQTITTLANIPSGGPTATLPQIVANQPTTSVISQELIILKERNRLTDYADQAIAEASSDACAALWRSLRDPELARLKHGAAAEILRVQQHFSKWSRVPPDYRLPVRDLFKDSAISVEADLSVPQILNLLLKHEDFHIRTRAAYILGGRKEPEIGDALIRAMKSDPILDVVREAQLTMEQTFGMAVEANNGIGIRLFDITSAEAWWKDKSAALKEKK